MGLDMYLYRRNYVQNWEHQTPEQRHTISVKLGDNVREDIKPDRIVYIVEQVAYWRKFNALHNWIVDNCAEGIDECQEICISQDKMKDLSKTLKKAKRVLSKASLKKETIQIGMNKDGDIFSDIDVYDCEDEIRDILPPASGFFFGSTQIDEYYKSEVERTIEIIDTLLREDAEGDFFYQASW
jgi:hypothetical protein